MSFSTVGTYPVELKIVLSKIQQRTDWEPSMYIEFGCNKKKTTSLPYQHFVMDI